MLKINMDEVQDFIVATNQITIPAAYFTQPINCALSLHVRPKTRSSKFYRKEVALPCPAQTWAQMDSRFPGPDSKLGISRAVPYASNQLWGKVLPTRRTATMETTAFSLTAARLTAINDFFRPSLTAQYGQAAAGAARLIRPGRRARKAGARATSIAQAVGPLGIKYTTPVSAAARKAGRVGKLRASFYVATMDANLHVTYPEHSGYRKSKTVSVPKVTYSPAVRAAIRKAMLANFKELSDDPKNGVCLAVRERVYEALGLPSPALTELPSPQ